MKISMRDSTALSFPAAAFSFPSVAPGSSRVQSIDLLRGVVMIIMALDHVRDYFHYDAFFFSPTDLSQTSPVLFFTRWITHFCAPVFIFLAGTSAYLSGKRRTKKELSLHLLTRGLWLILVELFIVGLFRTFNPSFHFLVLQVIGAIGISMIALSLMIYLKWWMILSTAILIIGGHNLLDPVYLGDNNFQSFTWSLLHAVGHFSIGNVILYVHYPVLPWIGVMTLGFCFGKLYDSSYDPVKRKRILFRSGLIAIFLFIILRSGNFYGDPSNWSVQKNFLFNLLSFANVTKYPPSLLYVLITIGPALIFLSLAEKPLNRMKSRIVTFGRVAMFYYLAHILLIHLFALIGAVFSGYNIGDMILSNAVNDSPQLKGYGFGLITVYFIWIGLVLMLYPLCKLYDRYKTINHVEQKWLSYL